LNNISSNDYWCPFCANQKLCNCNSCFSKSFASHSKYIFWDHGKNKDISPRDVFKNSDKKFWFKCENNHEFNSSLGHISGGNWCPLCTKKTEAKFFKWFKNKYDYKITRQPKYDWCKNIDTGRHLPFDFSIESLKLIIEIDGPQHFKQISNWSPPEFTQKRDVYKTKKAQENGYRVIRILQEDIWYDRNDWEEIVIN
jgi:very-short-patch-repair endonuclease